jgi:hypothetical protein
MRYGSMTQSRSVTVLRKTRGKVIDFLKANYVFCIECARNDCRAVGRGTRAAATGRSSAVRAGERCYREEAAKNRKAGALAGQNMADFSAKGARF